MVIKKKAAIKKASTAAASAAPVAPVSRLVSGGYEDVFTAKLNRALEDGWTIQGFANVNGTYTALVTKG